MSNNDAALSIRIPKADYEAIRILQKKLQDSSGIDRITFASAVRYVIRKGLASSCAD